MRAAIHHRLRDQLAPRASIRRRWLHLLMLAVVLGGAAALGLADVPPVQIPTALS